MSANNISVNLEFIEDHLPGLKDGEYSFEISQKLKAQGISGKDEKGNTQDFFTLKKSDFNVFVKGERFQIKPTEIHSVFPPENSLGEYSNVLPHIIINRSTLPWERMGVPDDSATEQADQNIPWMALLVFNADELVDETGTLPTSPDGLKEVQNGTPTTFSKLTNIPFTPEPGQDPEENVNIIYVKNDVLQKILPQDTDELRYLTHAREANIGIILNDVTYAGEATITISSSGKTVHKETVETRKAGNISINPGPLKPAEYSFSILLKETNKTENYSITLGENDQVGTEVAVVMANRLPASNKKSIVHLVSLEGRYNVPSGTTPGKPQMGSSDTVSLVSLKSWSFNSVDPKKDFCNILTHLNHPFVFGFDATKVTSDLKPGIVPQDVHGVFLTGNCPLSPAAKITDLAIGKIEDENHLYFIGKTNTLYLGTGRAMNVNVGGYVTLGKGVDSSMIAWCPIAKGTIAEPVKGLNFWVKDGLNLYFVRQQTGKKRVEVIAIPGDKSPTLRLPQVENPTAEKYLKQGYTPFPHFFRRGGKSISWYRSPLLPGIPAQSIDTSKFPAYCSDELLRYFDDEGMFDTSYAAAWELGRLQALKSKRFSVSLYNWKRLHRQQIKAAIQQEAHAHLPFHHNAAEAVPMPDNIEKWLGKLSLLKSLPFNYLVPDERMLPVESIRYFYLDPSWVACLIDGAMSIGRVAGQAESLEEYINKLANWAMSVGRVAGQAEPPEPPHSPGAFLDTHSDNQFVTGILLRSAVVKGWPALQVNAYDYSFPKGDDDAKNNTILNSKGIPQNPLPMLRMERLSPNVLLCLFQGEAKVVDIHEKPEVVHYGFEKDNNAPGYVKELVNHIGKLDQSVTVKPVLTSNRRIEIAKLFNDVQNQKSKLGYKDSLRFTTAQFALSMVEGVERVRFIMG